MESGSVKELSKYRLEKAFSKTARQGCGKYSQTSCFRQIERTKGEYRFMDSGMMIVTHDMKFARNVCNRAFYMDESGVYEDGTPEQIFEHPVKEKTRIFINQIKTMKLTLDVSDYDFQSVMDQIEEYCRNNLMEYRLINCILSVADELCGQILLPHMKGKGRLGLSFDYYRQQDQAAFTVRYGGNRFDPLNSGNEIALRILRNNTSGIVYQEISDGEYTNRVEISF